MQSFIPSNSSHSLPAGAGTAAIHPLPSMRHILPDRNPQDHTRACLCLFLRTQPEEETGHAILRAEASVPTADPLGPSQEAPCPAPVLCLPNGQEVLHVPERTICLRPLSSPAIGVLTRRTKLCTCGIPPLPPPDVKESLPRLLGSPGWMTPTSLTASQAL